MSHIFNHNLHNLKIYVENSEYWDLFLHPTDASSPLYLDSGATSIPMNDKCLISYIDARLDECTQEDGWLMSSSGYSWPCAYVSTDQELSALTHIGYVGSENGLPTIRKEMADDEKISWVLDSKYELYSGDTSLKLHKVSGYSKYDYSGISVDKTNKEIKLNGGFYQGFFATKDDQYKVLPVLKKGDTWQLEFSIKPTPASAQTIGKDTLNEAYPQNKGIFFYIGARAENKFSYLYNNTYSGESKVLNILNDSMEMKLNEDGWTSFVTDNKFLTFDRTKTGFKVRTYKEGDTMEYITRNRRWSNNPFLLFDRTKSGCTVHKAETCGAYKDKPDSGETFYNVEKDIYDNALAFYVTDDGSIGYKYLTLNCESSGDSKVECISGQSLSGIITPDEWNFINVRIEAYQKTMFLKFYVNGYLKFVSRELRLLSLRRLDELDERQEGVPYNISLGGGTQGLADMYLYGYEPTETYKLEENFCGTFIGSMRYFRFYNCYHDFNEMRQNYFHELQLLHK